MRVGVLVGLVALVAASSGARADETRNYKANAATGREIEFDHWLNYDESTCLDRGFVRVALQSHPKLGQVTVRRTHVKAKEGTCAGKRVSAVIVYYRAGSKSGLDQFDYTVDGNDHHSVNASVTVN